MAEWSDLAAAEPELAAAGERLLLRPGSVAFLATLRRDGGPRLHPVFPLLAWGRLFVFIVAMSPKRDDLLRDPRFAMHASPPPQGGEEFYLTGRAAPLDDHEIRAAVAGAAGRSIHDFEVLFSLAPRRVLHTTWAGWGTDAAWPSYARWRA